jgi:hypothetical protein
LIRIMDRRRPAADNGRAPQPVAAMKGNIMSIHSKRRAAGAMALAVALAAVAAFQGYGPVDASPLPPPARARCEAPLAGPSSAAYGIAGQIRYDSGLVLRYCAVRPMFAQLAAQEQPGLVRAAYVLRGGVWVDARQALYLRLPGGEARTIAPTAAQGATARARPALFSYGQLLRACARGRCDA